MPSVSSFTKPLHGASMTASRKLIIEYLERNPYTSSAELSRALKTTGANIRHHLGVLVQEGVVEAVARRVPLGRGRPAQLYALSSQARSHNLEALTSALLGKLLANLPVEDQHSVLGEIAIRLAGGEVISAGSSLAGRLTQAVQRLNSMGYKARWEAHSQAPRLVLGHCPYAAILPEHPELCRMDAAMLESLAGIPMRQEKKQAADSRGAKYCLFIAAKT